MAEAGYDVEGLGGKGFGLVPEGEVGVQGRLRETRGGERGQGHCGLRLFLVCWPEESVFSCLHLAQNHSWNLQRMLLAVGVVEVQGGERNLLMPSVLWSL